MPIFSLPAPYGIGTMGADARAFADFLAEAGQSCWQVLPLGPTSYGDSPYQSFSSFAGNPYFIDLDTLCEEGLLEKSEYQDLEWFGHPAYVDYGRMYELRYPVLRKACDRLLAQNRPDFVRFCQEEAYWLEDYALFMALKDKYRGMAWFTWPKGVRLRTKLALTRARNALTGEMAFWKGVQYLFFRQWWALKDYAHSRGISIIGDLPIYAAGDSADVWANQDQFQLDEKGLPTEVAGCPPDAFTADGQLWGNPLFDWEKMRGEGYAWWMGRIAFQFRLYDTLRIDHFRGFEAYYAIPYGETTARNGRWRPGPGIEFFHTLRRTLGERDMIAEDLGYLTPEVHEMLRQAGYPGMKILEFAFDSRGGANDYTPHRHPHHCVVYTGTHDNEPILGWARTVDPEDLAFAMDYLGVATVEELPWGMMRGGWASQADLAVMQFQDLLCLGSEARVNTPSTLGDNWKWRTMPGTYSPELAKKLRRTMEVYERLPIG